MKITVLMLLLGLSAKSEDLKLTDKERLAIRDKQVFIMGINNQMQALKTQFDQLQAQSMEENKKLQTIIENTKKSHKCEDGCTFDDGLTELKRAEVKPNADPSTGGIAPLKGGDKTGNKR